MTVVTFGQFPSFWEQNIRPYSCRVSFLFQHPAGLISDPDIDVNYVHFCTYNTLTIQKLFSLLLLLCITDLNYLCEIQHFFSFTTIFFYSATSTFWIANPNNNLINCAAAGSEVSCHFLISQPFPTPPISPVFPGGALSHYHIARSD